LPTLLIALSFPLAFGVWDFSQKKKVNPLSALGFVNVTVTGGLALLGLGGIWFSIKEAFFPSLIGLFVLGSAFGAKPFIKSVFLNPQVMDLEKIRGLLKQSGKEIEFERHLKVSTIYLSGSFFLSAILNFLLSVRVFTELPAELNDTERAIQLNLQIATMTKWSMVVILLPSMICLGLIMWHLLSGIRSLTGLKTEEFLRG
jgi:hypothetical protein